MLYWTTLFLSKSFEHCPAFGDSGDTIWILVDILQLKIYSATRRHELQAKRSND